MDNQWVIRNAEANDLNFIYETWLRSYCGDSKIGRSVRKSIFHREYRRIVDRLLFIGSCLVAVKPDDSLVIWGYLVFEPKILHYCFIKEAFRFSGIASSLVRAAVGTNEAITYTHHTSYLDPIVEGYPFLNYNPFILFKELEK